MKIHKQNAVIAYKPKNVTPHNNLGNEGKIEIKKFIDTCEFEKKYLTQLKRDEIFLNYNERLFIAMKHHVFLYIYKTNTMIELEKLQEDHKGGSLIYVPYNNSIYCVSGLTTVLCEKMELIRHYVKFKPSWQSVNKLNFPRAYYSSFVQDESKIYLILGFNLWDNEYLNTIEKLDVSDPNPKWLNVKVEQKKIPKISFAACIAVAKEEVYILGGKDANNADNPIIYLYHLKEEEINDSNMRLPLPPHHDTSQEMHESKNLFHQENSFVPLRIEGEDYQGAFLFGLFDSKNFLHLINSKNFDYSFINQDIVDFPINENDSDNDVEVGEEAIETETNKIKRVATGTIR
jgi:hypothetical protein